MSILAIDWTVDPAIFKWPFEVRYYGVFFAIAFLIGYQIMQRMYRAEQIPDKKLDKLLIYTLIATVVGARLGHVLFYGPYWDVFNEAGDLIETGYFSHPTEILMIRNGGLASHGAAIGIVLALWFYSRRVLKERSLLWTLDRVTVTVALAGFFIRMGNLFNHEIMGKVTDGWGFRFLYWDGFRPYDQVDMSTLPVRHPAQLYEALCYLVIFALMFFIFWKKDGNKKTGLMFGMFMTLVFTARFFIEFLKEHQSEALAEDSLLNMGQILSIPCVIIGVYFLIKSTQKPKIDQDGAPADQTETA